MVDRDLRHAERSENLIEAFNSLRRSNRQAEARRLLEDKARASHKQALQLLQQHFPLPKLLANLSPTSPLLLSSNASNLAYTTDPRLSPIFSNISKNPHRDIFGTTHNHLLQFSPAQDPVKELLKRLPKAPFIGYSTLRPHEAQSALDLLKQCLEEGQLNHIETERTRLEALWLLRFLSDSEATRQRQQLLKHWSKDLHGSSIVLDQVLATSPTSNWIPQQLSPTLVRDLQLALTPWILLESTSPFRIHAHLRPKLQNRQFHLFHAEAFTGLRTPHMTQHQLPCLYNLVKALQERFGDTVFSLDIRPRLVISEPDDHQANHDIHSIIHKLNQRSSRSVPLPTRACLVSIQTSNDPNQALLKASAALESMVQQRRFGIEELS